VREGDCRKASQREERDTGRHREHDDGRDASKDRKAEREVTEGDRYKSSHREERDSGSHKEHDERDRTLEREEKNGGSARSSRRGGSVSPEEHRHRGRHESNSSPRASRSAARIEVSGDIHPFFLSLASCFVV
jgi:smad nuclear-interacting protein 1